MPPRKVAGQRERDGKNQGELPVSSWRQVHKDEPASKRVTPHKRNSTIDSESQAPSPSVVEQFPSWIKNTRPRPAAAAAQPEDKTALSESSPPTHRDVTYHLHVAAAAQAALPASKEAKDAVSAACAAVLEVQERVLPVPKQSTGGGLGAARAQRARNLVAMAQHTIRKQAEHAGVESAQGASSEECTSSSSNRSGSGSAMPEALAFLESERRRGVSESSMPQPKDEGDSVGVAGSGSAALAATAFIESERRLSDVARAKAMTKALLATKKRAPRVPTLFPGMRPPHSPPKRCIPQGPRSPQCTADLRVLLASPTTPPAHTQLPLRYTRLMQQFDCLDTALSFRKTRRPTEVCTFAALKESVEQLDKRLFSLHNLLQIVAVAPAAYHLGWIQTPRYEVTVDFGVIPSPSTRTASSLNLSASTAQQEKKEEEKEAGNKESAAISAAAAPSLSNTPPTTSRNSCNTAARAPPTSVAGAATPAPTPAPPAATTTPNTTLPAHHHTNTPAKISKITPSMLSQRKSYFREQLVARVERYRSSRHPPRTPDADVHLEVDRVDDIEAAELPMRPDQLAAAAASAKPLAARACASPAVKRALELVAEQPFKGAKATGVDEPAAAAAAAATATEAAAAAAAAVPMRPGLKKALLKGLSPSLIEKIRAKEHAKKALLAEESAASLCKRAAAAALLAPVCAKHAGGDTGAAAAAAARISLEVNGRQISLHKTAVLFEMVHSIFRVRGATRRAMAQQALETALLNQHRDSSATRPEVRDQLTLLLRIAPEWCSETLDPLTRTPIFCVNPHAPTGPIRDRLRELIAIQR